MKDYTIGESIIGVKTLSSSELGSGKGGVTHIGLSEGFMKFLSTKNKFKFSPQISFFVNHNKVKESYCEINAIKIGKTGGYRNPKMISAGQRKNTIVKLIKEDIKTRIQSKEWYLIWDVSIKEGRFGLIEKGSEVYSKFPNIVFEDGNVSKEKFEYISSYLNEKVENYKKNNNQVKTKYFIFLAEAEDLKLGIEMEYALRSLKDINVNPSLGDKVIFMNLQNFNMNGFGEFTSNPSIKKYSKGKILGRSPASDKRNFPVVNFKLNSKEIQSKLHLKNQIGNLNQYATRHLITSELYYLLTQNSNSISPLNQILYGPPGTGKTYNVINEALFIVDPEFDTTSSTEDERRKVVAKFNQYKSEGRISFITFHQSYSYEDFVLGIMPDVDNHHLKFNRKEGIFYRIVRKAKNDKDNLPYVLVIDEINRANISRVFGELITLIEVDKRLGAVNELTVELPNEKVDIDAKTGKEIVKEFGVPSNLYLLGTMNTADKSIAALDIALRRRFTFKAYYPDKTKIVDPSLRKFMEELNKNMESNDKFYKGSDFTIGHSYFMNKTIKDCSEIFNGSVIPLLMEYYMNDIETVKELLKTIKLDPFYENGTIKIR